jgi:hypothetical protein
MATPSRTSATIVLPFPNPSKRIAPLKLIFQERFAGKDTSTQVNWSERSCGSIASWDPIEQLRLQK